MCAPYFDERTLDYLETKTDDTNVTYRTEIKEPEDEIELRLKEKPILKI